MQIFQHPMTSHMVNHFLHTRSKYYMYHVQYLFKIHFLAYVPNTISITHQKIFLYLHACHIYLNKNRGNDSDSLIFFFSLSVII